MSGRRREWKKMRSPRGHVIHVRRRPEDVRYSCGQVISEDALKANIKLSMCGACNEWLERRRRA